MQPGYQTNITISATINQKRYSATSIFTVDYASKVFTSDSNPTSLVVDFN